MLDHTPIVIDKFNGLFNRGEDDTCPLDHFVDCLNVDFEHNSVRSRPVFVDSGITISNIRRFHLYQISSEVTPRILVLTNTLSGSPTTGNLYDVTVSVSVPILTLTSVVDFSVVTMFDRCYITFHTRVGGASLRQVYVYDGTTVRKAAGSRPSTGLAAAESASAGVVSVGYHGLAYSFETPSGFITKPSAILQHEVVNPNFSLDLSSVDIGPSGTVRRHILATRRYNPDLEPIPEFFFVDTIENNVDTTKTINFYDFELVSSADYLFNLLEEIESGLFINKYRGRLVVGGESGNKSWVRLSKAGQPEAFDSVNGYIAIDSDDAGAVSNSIEYRGQLIITKEEKTYATVDNGLEPAFWEVIDIDRGIGAPVFGISAIITAKGSSTDQFLVASKSGLFVYTGYYNKPELSWKIEKIWERINWNVFNIIQIYQDPTAKKIYIGLPLDDDEEISHLLVGNYSNGLDSTNIRWTLWNYSSTIRSILINHDSSGVPILQAALSGKLIQIDRESMGYESGSGAAFFQTGFVPPVTDGGLYHFGAARFRVEGYDGTVGVIGNAFPTLYGLDNASNYVMTAINMPTTGSLGKEVTKLTNLVSEKASVHFGILDTNTFFNVRKIVIFAKKLWGNRVV